MLILKARIVPCSGRRPELKSVEFSEISILVSEIPTDRFTQEGFPLKGFAYWDFESEILASLAQVRL